MSRQFHTSVYQKTLKKESCSVSGAENRDESSGKSLLRGWGRAPGALPSGALSPYTQTGVQQSSSAQERVRHSVTSG